MFRFGASELPYYSTRRFFFRTGFSRFQNTLTIHTHTPLQRSTPLLPVTTYQSSLATYTLNHNNRSLLSVTSAGARNTMKCRAKPTSRGTAAAVIVAILCAAVAGSAAAPADGHQLQPDSVPASVREVPQRPMTVKSGGNGGDDADPFPIGRGEPFVVDPANVPQNHGPIAGFFDTRPLGPRSAAAPSDEYSSYDYADKVEEVIHLKNINTLNSNNIYYNEYDSDLADGVSRGVGNRGREGFRL